LKTRTTAVFKNTNNSIFFAVARVLTPNNRLFVRTQTTAGKDANNSILPAVTRVLTRNMFVKARTMAGHLSTVAQSSRATRVVREDTNDEKSSTTVPCSVSVH
ncbi:MAG: hypothetical protein NZM39_12325, partial [Bernardetiaceae bacterium]|nr:hypothetical protein [Bernardetiaceae bacterium]